MGPPPRDATTAAARSLVDVFPFAPVIATTVPSNARRSSAARSSSAWPVSTDVARRAPSTASAVAHHDGRAAPRSSASGDESRARPCCSPASATNRLPGRDRAGVGRHRRRRRRRRPSRTAPPTARATSAAARPRSHPLALRRASASRATSRSSNGTCASANSCLVSCPLPAITTTSPATAPRDRALGSPPAGRARRRTRPPSGVPPGSISAMIAQRVLRPRVVARHDDVRSALAVAAAPSGVAWPGRGRRRNRTRRSRGPSADARAARSTCSMLSGVCA